VLGEDGRRVPSWETCTPSHARCDNFSSDGDDDKGGDLAHTSVLRNRADEDATVEDWVVSVSWDAEPGFCLEAPAGGSWALRSTPSTIVEPDGWLA
jgi:hypothetical protein